MNSRERVLAALAHRQPDRVPVGPLFSPEIQRQLRQHLGLATDQDVYKWAGNDFVFTMPTFLHTASPVCYADPTIEVAEDGSLLDIYRVPFRVAQTTFQTYVEPAGQPPLQHVQTVGDLNDFPWPTPDMWDYSGIDATITGNPDKAIDGHSRGFFEISHFMRGMDQFLTDLALDPDLACAIMDHVIEHLLGRARRMLEAGDGRYTIFEYNDDVASQRSLFISPAMWRKYLKPRMAKFCDLYHSFGAHVRYHSCGSVRAIIPDLIEIGVNILNPIQPLATGMDPFKLKREFGKDLTFHGGIDIQDFLIHATPEEVTDHVKRVIDVVGHDGGYILAGSHSIQADTPVANVLAMFEAAGIAENVC